MNILILSGQFGMGHQMAAKAIGEQIEQLDSDACITELDLFACFYPHCSGLIFKAFHMLVEYCHGIYNLVYKLSGKMEVNVKPSGMKIYKKLQKMMDQYEPDVIVCTLPFCAKSIASYMEKTGSKISLVTCITDISMHPEWITSHTDAYLAPTREVKENLIKRGADSEYVFVTGIPVRQRFLQNDVKKLEKGSVVKKREDGSAVKNILIMGGGLGILPGIGKLIHFLHGFPGVSVTIITGKNHKVYKKWKDRYDDVTVLGYTESIDEYMKEADLVISKAGGITLFELVQCEVPLFIIHPFLEQEVNNAKYAERMHIGKVVWEKTQGFIPVLKELLTNDQEWEEMKQNMKHMRDEIIDVELADAMRVVLERAGA